MIEVIADYQGSFITTAFKKPVVVPLVEGEDN